MAYFFVGTILLSSSLLFVVQPLCAKMLLPTLGGTPAVWNTCMLFFQAGLLAGYAYAHLGPRILGVKTHALLQVALLASALLFLPVQMPREVAPPDRPVLWLLGTLLLNLGLPFFLIAGSGPLLQRWYCQVEPGRDPYFLYAASNLGSFAGLLVYPFLLEPFFTLNQQSELWRAGFVLLLAAYVVCAWCLVRKASVPEAGPKPVPPARLPKARRWRWVLLALVPSSLMLSVTHYLTTDIAPIPLLWVVPLGLYLLTFTLVFARRTLLPHRVMVRWMPLVVLILAVLILREGSEPLFLVLGLHLFGLFWIAMVCHGELAASRPPPEHLTEYYLWLALGGVLGGLLNAFVAPLLFTGFAEYPLMIAVACLLRPAPEPEPPSRSDVGLPLLAGGLTLLLIFLGRMLELEPGPLSIGAYFVLPLILVYTLQNRPLAFGLGLALVFAASLFYPGEKGVPIYRARSFFGIHRVTEQDGFRKLFHGNIVHGQQSLDPRGRREPLTYYHRTGPIGQVLTALKGDERLKRVGLVGLGVGSLASYAEHGAKWTFFEIDPAVVHIARDSGYFTYLEQSRSPIEVVVGDARLTIGRQQDKFGLLIIDAFGSDAIPLHLLTREALSVYLSKLDDDGILAFHISNLYVDLEPVLANLADHLNPKLAARIRREAEAALSMEDRLSGKLASDWLLLARRPEALDPILRNQAWDVTRPQPHLGVWTDDFSNLVSVFRWRE